MISFHQLYERHWRDVYRFALFLSGNPTHAEDLASDTFVRAWNARGSIRESTVCAYLLTITRNLWRDMKRRESRLVPLDDADAPSIEASADALVDLGWTERQLEARRHRRPRGAAAARARRAVVRGDRPPARHQRWRGQITGVPCPPGAQRDP